MESPAPPRRDRLSAVVALLAILFGLVSFRWTLRPSASVWEGPLLLAMAGGFALGAYLLAQPTRREMLRQIEAERAEEEEDPLTEGESDEEEGDLLTEDGRAEEEEDLLTEVAEPEDEMIPPPADSEDDSPRDAAVTAVEESPPAVVEPTSTTRSAWRMSDLRQSFSLNRVSSWRLMLFGVALVLSGLLVGRLGNMERPNYTLESLLWVVSTILYVVAVAPPTRRPREDFSLWWEINRPVVLLLVLIVAVGAFLRLWAIGTIPATVGGDEGSHGLEAARVLSGDIRNPFTLGWQGMPTLGFYYNSLGVRFFGQTVEGLRIPWAILGIGSILTTFWLVTRLRGLTLGLMTAALLAAYPYHIHFSRLGANNTPDPFFVSLTLLFLYRARDRGSPLDWSFTGLSMALSLFFYPGARFTVVLVAACVLVMLWERRQNGKEVVNLVGGVLTMAGAFLVAGAPILDLAMRFPDNYNSRLNTVGILQSGWLEREIAGRGTTTLNVLIDQFTRAFLSFNAFPDRTVWFGSPAPLMQGLWAVLFLLGLIYATLRLIVVRGDRLFPFVAWWWGIIVMGGMLTESPPSTARLLGAAPVACFFVALALLGIVRSVQASLARRDERWLKGALAVTVLALCLSGALWYFGDYQRTTIYGSRNGVIATALGKYLNQTVQPDQQVVVVGAPDLYAAFATIPYLAPQTTNAIDIIEPLTAPPTTASLEGLEEGKRPLFVVLPWRLGELPLIQQGFPSANTPQFFADEKDGLFWIYAP